jgi:hypothetical protein
VTWQTYQLEILQASAILVLPIILLARVFSAIFWLVLNAPFWWNPYRFAFQRYMHFLLIFQVVFVLKKDYVVTNVLSSAAAKRRLNPLEVETPTILAILTVCSDSTFCNLMFGFHHSVIICCRFEKSLTCNTNVFEDEV